jgi:hypothetical protein
MKPGRNVPVKKPDTPRDPYGQRIVFNDVHTAADDYEGVRVQAVGQDSPAEVAARVRAREYDRLGARYGLPGLIAAAVLVAVLEQLLGIEIPLL